MPIMPKPNAPAGGDRRRVYSSSPSSPPEKVIDAISSPGSPPTSPLPSTRNLAPPPLEHTHSTATAASPSASIVPLAPSPNLAPAPSPPLADAEALPVHPLYTPESLQSSAPVSASPERVDMPAYGSVTSRSRQRASLDASSYFHADDAHDAAAAAMSGSPPRRTSGLFGAFKERLHLKPSASAQGHDGGGSSSTAVKKHARSQSASVPVNGSPSATFARLASGHSSGRSSGKHTPSGKGGGAPQGDFANFLAASELKQRLAEEQELAIKRDIEFAKHPRRKAPKGKGKPGMEDEAVEALDSPPMHEATLEERGYFPGDLRHHGRIDAPRRRPSSRPTSRPTSVHIPAARRASSSNKIRPPAPCGTVEGSSSEEEEADSPPNGAAIANESALQLSDEEHSDEPGGKLRRRDSFESDASSTGTILDMIHERDASTVSLVSFGDDDSAMISLHSGGASNSLKKPLLELEELELDAFLKNFGRHTREVRVPQPNSVASNRMPKWEDFRVPADEAEVAAREGRRITVLTHVDRGLQRIAAVEGQLVAMPRADKSGPTQPKDSKSSNATVAKSNSKSKGKGKKKVDKKLNSTSSSGDELGLSTGPHVSWAPGTGGHGVASHISSAADDLGLRHRSIEKSERAARKEEAAAAARPSGDTEEWEVVEDAAVPEEDLAAQQDIAPGAEPRVDGLAFCIAYILALVERYAPEELDSSPDQAYRESKARSHVERLYLIAPFWEGFLFGARKLYRWEDPKRTGSAAMIYFTLWYTNMIPASFFLMLIYYILQFRFFPPDASVLHERVRSRMTRGVEADRLAERLRRRSRLDILEIYKRWVDKYGSASQLATGDVADFHEKVKNLILWRNPTATWRTLGLLTFAVVSFTFMPARWISKILWGFLGITFFCLLPLQSHYPRYRRPLSPVWWALWGTPTDAQFAIQLLRRRHLERQLDKRPPTSGDAVESIHDRKHRSTLSILTPNKRSSAAHAVAYGAMRPLKEGESLLSLEDHVRNDKGEDTIKPRKLGSFFCQHNAVPGHLHVTTRMIYFVALHSVRPERSHKSCKTPLDQVTGLVKTKSIRLVVWSSSGLQIQRAGKSSLFFSNMSHRDSAFNLILAIGAETWSKV